MIIIIRIFRQMIYESILKLNSELKCKREVEGTPYLKQVDYQIFTQPTQLIFT